MSQPNLNLNQFAQQPVVGMLATIPGGFNQTIQAVVSVNQASALAAGQAIKFDTALTTNNLPPIVSCAANAYADGYVIYNVKTQQASFTAGVVVEILLDGILWMLADGANVTLGNALQDTANAGGMANYATTGDFSRGTALDFGTNGQLFRALLKPAAVKAAQATAHA